MDASRSGAEAQRDAELVALARDAIARHLEGDPPPSFGDAAPEPHGGVFVTLWDARHHLRGCIGHITPIEPSVAAEVAACAVASATGDPRFPPLARDELDACAIELSLLGPLEVVAGVGDLDPARFGVVVAQGARRGVLLPGVEGVDTAEQQLAIAARKGHVDLAEPHRIQRFSARKVHEAARGQGPQGLRR
jgi:AmmeMemoRadiSam system protein A